MCKSVSQFTFEWPFNSQVLIPWQKMQNFKQTGINIFTFQYNLNFVKQEVVKGG